MFGAGNQGCEIRGERLFRKQKNLTMQGLYVFGAGNQVRTGDLYLGKVPLYQLSYSRFTEAKGALP